MDDDILLPILVEPHYIFEDPPVPPLTPAEIHVFESIFDAMSDEHRQILCLRDGPTGCNPTWKNMDEIAALIGIEEDEAHKRYDEAISAITDRVRKLFVGVFHNTPGMHPHELAWASERWHQMPEEYRLMFILEQHKLQAEIEHHLRLEAGSLSVRVLQLKVER